MLLEVACFNIESCIVAQKAGVSRIELCSNYKAGGITPAREMIKEARKLFSGALFVMIRPRQGDFNYTEEEFEQMKESILFCKEQKCNGVVFGILKGDQTIDTKRCEELVKLAKPMRSTFHRAFDECTDTEKALGDIVNCQFSRVLTSGGNTTALDGATEIKKFNSTGKNLTIMPGGGIRSENIMELISKTGSKEFHSAAITGSTEVADEKEIVSMLKILSSV